jgi:cation transport regulator ChaC
LFRAVGASGTNLEYLYSTAESLRYHQILYGTNLEYLYSTAESLRYHQIMYG